MRLTILTTLAASRLCCQNGGRCIAAPSGFCAEVHVPFGNRSTGAEEGGQEGGEGGQEWGGRGPRGGGDCERARGSTRTTRRSASPVHWQLGQLDPRVALHHGHGEYGGPAATCASPASAEQDLRILPDRSAGQGPRIPDGTVRGRRHETCGGIRGTRRSHGP